eukprot:gene19050-biopygen3979
MLFCLEHGCSSRHPGRVTWVNVWTATVRNRIFQTQCTDVEKAVDVSRCTLYPARSPCSCATPAGYRPSASTQ